ncbi:MAG: hypothetical protein FWD60_00795 [Candidatus Azobacteroides sp.]|nr:hypothetical protein [Candidatus Azobacteroides sp.]
MKRLFLCIAVLLWWTGYAQAQTITGPKVLTQEGIRGAAAKKVSEVETMVELSASQKNDLQIAAESYFWKTDSAKFIVKDAQTASDMKLEATKEFALGLEKILTDDQLTQYYRNKCAAFIQNKTAERAEILKQTFPENEVNSSYDALYDYYLKEKVINEKYKYDKVKREKELAILSKNKPEILSKKIISTENIVNLAKGKTTEIDNIVTLTETQKEKVQKLSETYFHQTDSAKYLVKDGSRATEMKEQAAKKFALGLEKILTDDQLTKYYQNQYAAFIQSKTAERAEILKQTFPENEVNSSYDALYDYLLKEKVINEKYKYDKVKREKELAALSQNKPGILSKKTLSSRIVSTSERKTAEIDHIVALTKKQKEKVQKLSETYFHQTDSARNIIKNAQESASVKFNANKEFFNGLMKILTESQQETYLKSLVELNVKQQTEQKISYLKAENKYTDNQLAGYYTEIYDYLVIEKMANARYKYNPKKQKETGALIRKQMPNVLKQARALEKANAQGKSYVGTYQW